MQTTKVEISQKTIIFTVTLLLSLWVLYQVQYCRPSLYRFYPYDSH